MKFVGKFLNLLLLCVMFCMITIAEWGIYNLIALPAENSTIGIKSTDENVSYVDTFKFLGEDLKQSVTREPRYLIRGWFKWDWWNKGMRWADVAVEAVTGAIVPIFSPMYEVKEIQYYYSPIGEVKGEVPVVNGTYAIRGIISLDEYVVEPIDHARINPEWEILHVKEEYIGYSNIFVYFESKDSESDYVSGGKLYKITNADLSTATKLGEWNAIEGEEGYIYYPSGQWIGGSNEKNRSFINVAMKLNKYNDPVYKTWINKFYTESNNGLVIKTSVAALYFQFYMAIIISIWFICQNPVVINRTETGENAVSGGIRWRHRAREKKNKKKEKDGGK